MGKVNGGIEFVHRTLGGQFQFVCKEVGIDGCHLAPAGGDWKDSGIPRGPDVSRLYKLEIRVVGELL